MSLSATTAGSVLSPIVFSVNATDWSLHEWLTNRVQFPYLPRGIDFGNLVPIPTIMEDGVITSGRSIERMDLSGVGVEDVALF